MKTPSDDEIQRFFDSITPEDFARDLSDEDDDSTETEYEDYPRFGNDEFDRFTLDNLHQLSETDEPFAALHNGVEHRRIVPLGSESIGSFLKRVRREAKEIQAKWFFIGTEGEASMGAVFDPRDPKDVANARQQGRMMDVINWYSESIEPTSAEVRFGIIYEENDEKRIVQSTYTHGADPAFKKVLR